MEVKELLEKIKPKNIKKNDKYSFRIWRYIKNQQCMKVYVSLDEGEELDLNNINTIKTYIGREVMDDIYEFENDRKVNIGSFSGRSLSSIFSGKDLKRNYCYCGFGGSYPKKWIDITDYFWEKYIAIGLCLIYSHNSYIQNEDRFTIDKDIRVCNYCGQEQKMHIKRTVNVIEEEIWTDI